MDRFNANNNLPTSLPIVQSGNISSYSSNDLNQFDVSGQNILIDEYAQSYQLNLGSNPWPEDTTLREAHLPTASNADPFHSLGPWSESASFESQALNMSSPIVGMNRMVPEGEAKLGVDIEIPLADESHTSDARLISNEPGSTSERTSPTHYILQRYQGQHGQSYLCKESSCNYRRFSDKGGLQRHSREVHGPGVHYCPFVSCNRHKKGFPRKYNLLTHQKRCHRDQFVHPSQQCKVPHSHAIEKAEHDRIPAGWLEQPNGEVNHESGRDTKSRRGEAVIGEERLRRKLQNLKELRAELNRDIDHEIEILEGVLNMMIENSS